LNLFNQEAFTLRKKASLRELPRIPVTGWKPPQTLPNLSGARAIGFDVETFDPDLTTAGPGWARGRGHIVGVSLAAQDRTGNRGNWYFPLRHEVGGEDNLDPRQTLGWLKEQLETPTPKVGANLLYDCGWLAEENIFVNGDLYDCQFAEALIDENALVALDVLAHKYLRQGKVTSELYAWLRSAYPATPERETRANIYRAPPCLVGPYAEADAFLPLDIIDRQWPELVKQELTELFRLENDLIPLLVRMRREGVTVDVAKAEQMKHELTIETAALYARVKHEYGVTLESCSTANLARLFDTVGITYPRAKPTRAMQEKDADAIGNPSFEKEWLKALEHPLGELVNDIREHEKIVGTFLQSYIIDKSVDGKLFPQFHPLKGDKNGTMVGRFASSDPNLQNIPSRTALGKKVRQAFTHDAGHFCWQKNDYSQIHYRILAHYAVDAGDGSAERLRESYRNDKNMDYHLNVFNNVAPLMGWDATDAAVVKEKRRPIKNVNFGLLYGQTEKSLAYSAGLTGEQAKEFFKSYHSGAPYVKATMAAIGREVQEFGYVRTLLGRRVRFPLFEPDGYGRSTPLPLEQAVRVYGSKIKRAYEYRGVNYKFQGSEPDIIKTGMRACLRSGVFDAVGVPRITVHDELDFSVRDDSPETREAFRFIKETMEGAIKLRIPVNVDQSRGPNWGLAD
jgi:DNA polymerase-1